MPDFTLYVSSVDVSFWGTIFNIVAMICSQDAFIWGFAALASTFLLFKGQAAASVNAANGNMGTILAHNAVGAIIPFVLASALNSAAFQSTVNIESTTSGRVTAVANVPGVISVMPAGASIIMRELQGFVRSGFLVAGTDYADISARDNGFINPLKVLLTARSTVPRLGTIDSDVNAIVSSCLGPESGVDFGKVNALVLNAGNGSATGSSQGATVANTIAINGVMGTSLGALLKQASLQTTTFVSDITNAAGAILSCPDAVTVVQGRIDATLNSEDFSRVTVGAVNGMDDPMPGGNFDLTKLTASYTAYRKANAVVAATGVGATAAAAETINLLMVDVVGSNLNCLKASSSDKTQCYAAMIQSSETERTNLARISEAIPALQYAGAFFNDLLALVVVLGPIIVMFMMFAGQDVGRSIKALAHILVWPMLSMGVGAEAINGMLAIHTSNFLTTISNGGYLAQSQALEVYKHFALEIGSASSMMASLPSIMSIIFALGGASALSHHVPQPKVGDAAKDGLSPRLSNDAPILQKSAMATAQMGTNFANIQFTGGANALSSTAKFHDLSNNAQRGLQEAVRKEHSQSEGRANLATWQAAFKSGDYSGLNIDKSTGERIRKAYEENTSRRDSTGNGTNFDASKTNYNDSNASVGGGGSAGLGKVKALGISGSVDVSGKTATGATDTLKAGESSHQNKEIAESAALSKAITQEAGDSTHKTHGNRYEKELAKTLSTQQDYRDNLTKTESSSDSYSRLASDNSGLLLAYQSMTNAEVGQQMNANPDFRLYNSVNGKAFEMNPSAAKFMSAADDQSKSGSTDQLYGDKDTQKAAQRLRAASLMALDSNSSESDKKAALEYVAGASGAMAHASYKPETPQAIGVNVADPKDKTGVDQKGLQGKVNKATHQGGGAPSPSHKPGGKGAGGGGHTQTPPVRPAPAPKTEMEQERDSLSKKQKQGVHGEDIKTIHAINSQVATDAGLVGDSAHGTAARTRANVAENLIADTNKTPAEQDRTSLKSPDKKVQAKGEW